jgi:hypothetical protein
MEMEDHIRKRLVKNMLLSVLIYLLPILLMFLTLFATGQRPWEHKRHPAVHAESK